jgi:hypothetical protein
MLFAIFSGVCVIIAIMNSGCSMIRDMTEDKSYLTPVPQATIDAYLLDQPLNTKLQAVIAAQKGILTFHRNWIRQPIAIYAEKMIYKDAINRVDKPGSTDYYDSTPSDTLIWLVVFKGEWTYTEPLGTVTPPLSGCAFAIINVDGNEMRAGDSSCETLNLEQ